MLGDCHIHMLLDGVNYRAAIDAHKKEPIIKLIRARLTEYKRMGISFLRDGGDKYNVGACARAIAQEYGITYLSPIFPIHKNKHYGSFIGYGFDNIAEYKALLNKAKSLDADFIKIMISGLIDFNFCGKITEEPLTLSEITEMTHLAHDMGFAVMAHANGAECVKNAIIAGVDSIEHGAYLDKEAIAMLASSNTIWVPTVSTIANLIGSGRHDDSVLAAILENHLSSIHSLIALGGKIALGSDAGAFCVHHGTATLDEYALLKPILGNDADIILTTSENEIRQRFTKRAY